MVWLRERLPDDAIVTSDAGNFSGWPNRFLQYRRPGRQLGPTSGAMGQARRGRRGQLFHPAESSRVLRRRRIPDDPAGAGDRAVGGGRAGLLLFNNAMYGTIRMHQERRFPEKLSAPP